MLEEITGKRDPFVSVVHRLLGKSLWMMDIDCYEYTAGTRRGETIPLALIECKRNGTVISNSSREALVALADRAQLPAFALRYWPAELLARAWFHVVALNAYANDLCAGYTNEGFKCFDKKVDAAEFAAFLHRLRGIMRSDHTIKAKRGEIKISKTKMPTEMVNYANE